MKKIVLILIILMSSASFSIASTNNDQEIENKRHYQHEKLHDDIMELVNQVKYDLNRIRRQEELVDELRMKIKDLEHNIFQANQSVRNLELEVWDLNDSLKELSKKPGEPQ
jgi:peptidoglycan hydrolase CwlO-like protein